MQFTSKQVVAMVACVCAAVVLAPVGVMAATGSLVNIVDPTNSSRQAKVTSNGALMVENRSFIGGNAFNASGSKQNLGWIPLASTTGPTRIAITEMTLTGSFDPDPGSAEVWLDVMIRTSGTAACNGPGSPGYTRTTLRRVMIHSRQTLVLPFAGQPLVLPPAANGQPTCFGVTVQTVTNGLYTFAGATGYRFVG